MKQILFVLIFLGVPILVGAQQITGAEYFFDRDPGIGMGQPIGLNSGDTITINSDIPTDGLSPGMHNLYVRFTMGDTAWSIQEGGAFYIEPSAESFSASELAGAEYFFDRDPGIGQGTPLSFQVSDTLDLMHNISVNSLSPGMHRLYVRYRDSNGQPGLYEGNPFYVQPIHVNDSAIRISQAEYYFDNDPGIGNGQPLELTPRDTLDWAGRVSVEGLVTGMHRLFLRFQDAQGAWSLYEGGTFYVQQQPLSAEKIPITQMEYFLNDDPGAGRATGYPITKGDTIEVLVEAALGEMSFGDHAIGMRVKDSLGRWSMTRGDSFQIKDCQPPLKPALPLGATSLCPNPSDTGYVTESTHHAEGYEWKLYPPEAGEITGEDTTARVAWNNLYTGQAWIMVRGINNCAPGPYSDSLLVTIYEAPDKPVIEVLEGPVVCRGDTARLTSSPAAAYLWSNGATTQTISITEGGQYSLVIQNEAGCTSLPADSLEITLNELPQPDLGKDTSIAGDQTMVLDPGDFNTYLWNDNSTESTLTVSQPGLYWVEVTDGFGCSNRDSIRIYGYYSDTTMVYKNICNGQSYAGYTETGTYFITRIDRYGRDSIIQLHLSVNPNYLMEDTLRLCQGDTGLWRGNLITQAGNYTDSLLTTQGCDSVYRLTCMTSSSYQFNHTATICQGRSYFWRGNSYSKTGMYYDSLLTHHGCDSIYRLALMAYPSYYFQETAAICEGETYLWHGQQYQNSGVYGDSLVTIHGCDSSYRLTLTVYEKPEVYLGPDQTITTEQSLVLDPGSFESYLWQDRSTSRTFTVVGSEYLPGDHEFWVEVTDEHACQATDVVTITIQNASGLGQSETNSKIRIYPNPARNQLNIECLGLEREATFIQCIAADGRVVYNKQLAPGKKRSIHKMDIGGWPSGMYTIQIISGGKPYIRRLIIE